MRDAFLATQHQEVVGSIVELEGEQLRERANARTEHADPIVIGPIADIRDGEAVLDEHQLAMQPDWSFDEVDSGKKPATRFHEPHPNAGLTTLHPQPVTGPRWTIPSLRPAACTKPWRFPRRSWRATPRSASTGAPIDTDDGEVVVIHEQNAPESGEPAPGS